MVAVVNLLARQPGASIATTVLRLVAEDGTASARHAAALRTVEPHHRDMADAVHALGALHNAYPGLVGTARATADDGVGRDWLSLAAETMATERLMLARLTALVGPLPSTPGHAAFEAALVVMRQALETLARSARRGCALGATAAFVLDWQAVRDVLLPCARANDVLSDAAHDALVPATHRLLSGLTGDAGLERAIAFGTQQMLLQHRGLWDLLEARASARNG